MPTGAPPDLHTDVVVVGAGPAGLTLALLLARSGVDVTVVDRSTAVAREFRGEILQPGGQRLLDQLGVLAAARERGAHEHRRFLLEEHGRVLIDGDYRALPGPHACLLSLPQQHLLSELRLQCERYDNFRLLLRHKVVDLVRDVERVRGVICRAGEVDQVVRARCVVGADGRYSTVRTLAGLPEVRSESFDQDVLWFKLDAGGPQAEVRIFRAGGNPLLSYTSYPDRLQLGWTLPHQGYRALAADGLAAVKERIAAAAPQYRELIESQVTRFADLSLLDVFVGGAGTWTTDGVVLIGDSAHTMSPIGAQGINLSIQDAVALHPVLVEARREDCIDAARLTRFAEPRRRDVDRMVRIQRTQSSMMLSSGRLASIVRPRIASLISRTPVYRKTFRQIAFGNESIRVAADPTRPAPTH